MLKIRSYRILLAILGVILEISATTHWVVTENGKIQAQTDTVFETHDLLMFLNQGKREDVANAIRRDVLIRKTTIERQLRNLDSAIDFERKLYSDCITAGMPICDIDVYASIVIDASVSKEIKEKYVLEDVPIEGRKKIPDCKKTFPLDFSIHTFENLSAMKTRKNLTQPQEIELLKHLPPGVDLEKFGHQIAHKLAHNKTSWIHLNLASIYWRIKGDAYNALECSRRAIISAPWQYRDIPLLTTAGILHAAQHSGEAAIILHVAIDYNPLQSYLHLALGHIYVVLGDHNRAIACYENCLKLDPNMTQAKEAKHALLCQLKIERTLKSLQQNMQDIVGELDIYHKRQEEWVDLSARMLWEQTIHSPYVRDNPNAIPTKDKSIEHMVLSVQFDIDTGFRLLTLVENYVDRINHIFITAPKRWQVPDSKNQPIKMAKRLIQNNKESLLHIQSLGVIENDTSKIKTVNYDFEDKTWPRLSDCDDPALLSIDTKQYVPIYLSPESRGYETHLFLNELIGIPSGQKHSLPWYPPVCDTPKTFNQKYISNILLSKVNDNNNSPDNLLKPILSNLVKDYNLAEIGQRILTATRMKVTASWVLSTLASLHWRVVGKPRNALDCLQLALEQAPEKFKDVPLISIASISHKTGLIDEALKITKEALNINAAEPTTNFLLGILLHLKGNNSGAILHLKQAIQQDLHLYDGKALMLLKKLACNEKYNIAQHNRSGCDGDGVDLHSFSYTIHLSPGILKKYNLQEGDTLLCKSEGKKRTECKHIDCFAVEMDKIIGVEIWSIHKVTSIEVPRQKTKRGKHSISSSKLPGTNVDIHEIAEDGFHVKIVVDNDVEMSEIARVLDNILTPNFRIKPDSLNMDLDEINDENVALTREECRMMRYNQREAFIFIWNNIATRNIDIRNEIATLRNDLPSQQPICKVSKHHSRYINDGEKLSRSVPRKIEPDMVDWLIKISGYPNGTIHQLGTKIAVALQKNDTSWILAMAASFYWRTQGDSRKVFDCILQALEHSPKNVQDILLFTLASFLGAQDQYRLALQIAQWALILAPHFILNRFIIANLHTALGNFEIAVNFYKSTLALDPHFKPAHRRLKAILCFLTYTDITDLMNKISRNIL